MAEPIITKTMTEDGWVSKADYGKEGTTTCIVHIPPATEDEIAGNRRDVERVLMRLGHRVESWGAEVAHG